MNTLKHTNIKSKGLLFAIVENEVVQKKDSFKIQGCNSGTTGTDKIYGSGLMNRNAKQSLSKCMFRKGDVLLKIKKI